MSTTATTSTKAQLQRRPVDTIVAKCPTVVDTAFNRKQLAEVFAQNEVVGLYFSSYSCPACKRMTPRLIEAYQDLKRRGLQFEMVFVSGDVSQHDFVNYFFSMPWLTLPDFPVSPGMLYAHFRVWVMPTLILLRPDGTVISRSGCSLLLNKSNEFPWPNHRDFPALLSFKACIAFLALAVLATLLYMLLMAR